MSNRTEHVESKMMESYQAGRRHADGLSGVFDELADEHSEISMLLSIEADELDGSNRRHRYSRLRQRLLAHEIFELEELYPILEKYEATTLLAAEHAEDAAAFEAAVKHLDSLDIDGPDWQPEFKRLIVLFEQHVDQEEYDYFPEAQQQLGREESSRLQSRYIAARHAALKLPG